MLRVRTEYKKGVLFVRIVGRVDNEGYLNDIQWLIEEVGIKFTVLDLTYSSNVSFRDIQNITRCIKRLEKNRKLLLICDKNSFRDSLFRKGIMRVKSEMDAFSLLNRKGAYG